MDKFRFTVACLALLWAGLACLPAQTVTLHLEELSGALGNPLMGFRPDINSAASRYAYPTVVRHYIRWNQIENNQSDTVQKIRDYCNAQWAGLPENNQKVIPRVYIDWDSATGNEYWPADLQTGDWSSQAFKDRVVRLIGWLGEVWDNDPRVAWVQVGIIGYWGEQENPVSVSQDGWAQRLGNAFKAAFKNKKYLVRNLNHFSNYEVGTYWDSFAHPQQPNVRNTINTFNAQVRYLSQVVEGEVAYNWGEGTFDPKFGGEPEITLNSAVYTDSMIDVIRELHCSALGWIASYKLDGSHGSNPDTVRANAARVQKEFGYRFVIPEFTCAERAEPGAPLNISFKVKNVGSAPFYENWPVALVLIDPTTRQTVWQGTLPGTDTRTWVPGDNYSYATRTYQTPAPERSIAASVTVPSTLPKGEYLVGISILEPTTGAPGVFFATPNFFKESQTQPLCRIGVGVTVDSHALNGVSFDDLVEDDARYYTLNQPPAVTTQPQSLSVAPGGSATLTVTTAHATGASLQWFFHRAGMPAPEAIAGATDTSHVVGNVGASDMGAYFVRLSQGQQVIESQSALLTTTDGSSRLSNLSARGRIAAGGTLTPGFVLSGHGTKQLLIRSVGPTLTGDPFNLDGFVSDPFMELIPLGGHDPVATSDNWGNEANAAAIRITAATVGAFPLAEGSADATLLKFLPLPNAIGSYGYSVRMKNLVAVEEGLAIAEVYDPDLDSPQRLVNVSALGFSGMGANALISGFVISGAGAKTMLVRVVGPTLENFGVTGFMTDPRLRVVPLGQDITVASNDNWGGTTELKTVIGSTGSFGFAADDSLDAAVLVRLPPGGYTVVVEGAANGTGNVLVEAYEVE